MGRMTTGRRPRRARWGMGPAIAASVASALVCAATVLPAGQAGALPGTSAAGFLSQTGDSIGQGNSYTFTTVTADPSTPGSVSFGVSSTTDEFTVMLSAPTGDVLSVGTYSNAQRFAGAGVPGVDVFGDGRGCNTTTGSFTVYDVSFSGDTPVSFAAQFTQHCEGNGPALYGYVMYQSGATLPSWIVASQTTMAFGNVRVGDTPATSQSMQLGNLGGPTTITGFSLSGVGEDDYIGQTTCDGATLGLGDPCNLDMQFWPGEPGARDASLVPQGVSAPPVISLTGAGTVGYYQADSAGDVFPFGDAGWYGDMGSAPLNAPMVSMATTTNGYGYWLLGQDGGIFSFGTAKFYGSTGNIRLNQPVVSMAATPDGYGYWFVAADGGIFSYGDAKFHGSMGGHRLNSPIVGMASTPDGRGYWLVAADGGMFSFGDAKFFGSMGGKPLNSRIVGMAATPDGRGYWLVAADGGMFSFGNAKFYGSMGRHPLNQPIVGMAPTWDGRGYWLTSYDGGVFAFGDAPYYGAPTGPGAAGGIAIVGTAPPTLQAVADVPSIRRGAPALRTGWHRVAAG